MFRTSQGMHIFGINISRLGASAQIMYILVAFGVLGGLLMYAINKILPKEEEGSDKKKEKRRSRDARNKAKTR